MKFQNDSSRREYERLRKREQRKKIYGNKSRHATYKQQFKMWRMNRKTKGKIKLIKDLSETQQVEQRKIWRQQHNYYRHGIPICKNKAQKLVEMKIPEDVCRRRRILKTDCSRCTGTFGK